MYLLCSRKEVTKEIQITSYFVLKVYYIYASVQFNVLVCSLVQAYASIFKNSLTLYIGKGGELQKVGDFSLVFNEMPYMSEPMMLSNPGPGPGGAEDNNKPPPNKKPM